MILLLRMKGLRIILNKKGAKEKKVFHIHTRDSTWKQTETQPSKQIQIQKLKVLIQKGKEMNIETQKMEKIVIEIESEESMVQLTFFK